MYNCLAFEKTGLAPYGVHSTDQQETDQQETDQLDTGTHQLKNFVKACLK
jgi:hypothetical protein